MKNAVILENRVIEEWTSLVGRTIAKAELIGTGSEEADDMDVDHLLLTFTNGTSVKMIPDYGIYTGRSSGEYPTLLEMEENE